MLTELTDVRDAVRARLLNDPFAAAVAPQFLRHAVLAYPERGGKCLRAALHLWACGAAGGDPARSISVAAAIEVVQVWTLVHDDIIDDDDVRRGGPSAHQLLRRDILERVPDTDAADARRFGVSQAILTGDIQQAWSNHIILQSISDGVPTDVALALLSRLNGDVVPGIIMGEAMDVEFETRPVETMSDTEIMGMLRLKTAVLLRFAAESGVMTGRSVLDTDDTLAWQLGDMAEKAGLAFQLQDDLLGLYGDPKQLGKPVGSDLRSGKRTLVYTKAARSLEGAELERFRGAYGNAAATDEDCAAIAESIDRCGVRAAVEEQISEFLTDARAVLDAVSAGPYRDALVGWLDTVARRRS